MQKFIALFCVSVSLLFGADAGFNQGNVAKPLPEGSWQLTTNLFQGRYGFVIPSTKTYLFDRRVDLGLTKFCYGVKGGYLEACGEASAQKITGQFGFGGGSAELKYRTPLYMALDGGEAEVVLTGKVWTPFSITTPVSTFIPKQAGDVTMAYGASYQPKATFFVSKEAVTGEIFASYRFNGKSGVYTPGNTACGGGSFYLNPRYKSQKSVGFITDAWYCQQQGSLYSGKSLTGGRHVAGVGPGLVVLIGNVYLKASFGFLVKKPQGPINLDPEQNDGVLFSLSFRR